MEQDTLMYIMNSEKKQLTLVDLSKVYAKKNPSFNDGFFIIRDYLSLPYL